MTWPATATRAAGRRVLCAAAARPYYRLGHPIRQPRRARIREELLRSQYLPVGALRNLQQRRLRRVLARAVATSTWYRERLRGLPPPGAFTLEDLPLVPILEKHELQAHLDEISGSPEPSWVTEASSGSTGEPVRLHHDRSHIDAIAAELERDFAMCSGYRLDERRAYLWGTGQPEGGLSFARDILMSRMRLSGVATEGEGAAQVLEQLEGFAPRLLVGYVSMLRELARAAQRPLGSLRAVQASAETLTPEDRLLIQARLGAPVYNRYGAREVGNLAHECDAHDGLHLLMENNIVELVDDAGRPLTTPGDEGDVVVTSLTNFATPLIRYRLGDVARLGEVECPCGRGSPKLDAVLGRTSEVIVSPGGRRLMGRFFSRLFFGEPVHQFLVEQTTPRSLRITVVPDVGYSDEVRERILRVIHRDGDPAFEVEWRTATHLERTSAGKRLFIRSLTPRGS